jgi:hypothetical protein
VSHLGADALAGELLLRCGYPVGAAQLLGRALRSDERNAQVHVRLAEALCDLDDLPGAIEHYESAKRLLGNDALVDSNLGIVLTHKGELDAAMDVHRRALAAVPHDRLSLTTVAILWNAAHTWLAAGRLAEGWNAYEARIPLGLGPAACSGLPDWGAAGIDARSVVVLEEQGVGDQVLFASCLADLIGEAREVFVECDPRLAPLMARSFPAAHFGPTGGWSLSVGHGDGGPEAYIALGSLPRRYRRTLDRFPVDGAYLHADPERVDAWRERLQELPAGRKVGISWRSIFPAGARTREYGTLRDWAPILKQPGVQFVSLQYGDCEQELVEVAREFGVHIAQWADFDPFNDLDGVAALIDVLDAVIAPRNSVAHLAGAIGTCTFMLANPYVWSDLGTGAFPWFPAVTMLYRTPGESWAEPIRQVAEAIGQMVESRKRCEA